MKDLLDLDYKEENEITFAFIFRIIMLFHLMFFLLLIPCSSDGWECTEDELQFLYNKE